jgi:hypothetical protein
MVLEMKYYFKLGHDPKSPKYMQVVSVLRWYHNSEGEQPEVWNGKRWESNSTLITAKIGRKNDYEETDEKQAMAFLMGRKIKGVLEGNTLRWETVA